MFDLASPETEFAIAAVRRAAELVRDVQGGLVTGTLTKDDRSPVTVADFASQALIGRMLRQAFPGDPVLAEEDSSDLRRPESRNTLENVTGFVSRSIGEADPDQVCDWIDHNSADAGSRFWTLDPVDGTKGFLRGGQYAVALALVEDGIVQIGALGCPNLEQGRFSRVGGSGSILFAVRGAGSWWMEMSAGTGREPLAVSDVNQPAKARLLRSFEAGHTDVGMIESFITRLGTRVESRRMDSQAKYSLLAAGAGEIYLRLLSPARPDYRERIWDQAAGSLVLEEAGGQISDLDGKPLDFSKGRRLEDNRGVLATNKLLQESALNALKAIGA